MKPNPRFSVAALGLVLFAIAIACAPATPVPVPPSPATATPPPPTATPVFPKALSPAPGQEQFKGVLRSVGDGRVTLVEGQNIPLTPETRFIRVIPKKTSDLQAGSYTAITAVPQPDGSLLASHIAIFPPGSTIPAGQRPDWEQALMTNATVEAIEGDLLTVRWPAGDAKVRLRPDVQVFVREFVTQEQLRAGMPVTVVVGPDRSAVSVSFP